MIAKRNRELVYTGLPKWKRMDHEKSSPLSLSTLSGSRQEDDVSVRAQHFVVQPQLQKPSPLGTIHSNDSRDGYNGSLKHHHHHHKKKLCCQGRGYYRHVPISALLQYLTASLLGCFTSLVIFSFFYYVNENENSSWNNKIFHPRNKNYLDDSDARAKELRLLRGGGGGGDDYDFHRVNIAAAAVSDPVLQAMVRKEKDNHGEDSNEGGGGNDYFNDGFLDRQHTGSRQPLDWRHDVLLSSSSSKTTTTIQSEEKSDNNPNPKRAELEKIIEQRQRYRKARNQAMLHSKSHKRERLEEILGSLHDNALRGGDLLHRQRQQWKPSNRATSIWKQVLQGLGRVFFGMDPTENQHRNAIQQKNKRTWLRDLPPPQYTREQLQALYANRVQRWKGEGIFYNYSQPAVPNNSTLPPPPQVCTMAKKNEDDEGEIVVVVLVLSSRSNHEMRQAIRETWGRGHCVLFVIGGAGAKGETASPVVQERLLHESNQYHDLLDSIHPESYISLPYKLHFGYTWIIQNLPSSVQWIVKADDDMVVRVSTLQRALLNLYNAEIPIVLGRIVPHSPVERKGKWAEYQYPNVVYPYWPQGSRGHVVSRPVAEYLASVSNLTYYQGEDTSLGIWLDEASTRRQWKKQLQWIHSPYFQNHGQCQEEEWLIIGHKLRPNDIRSCFEKMDEWDLSKWQQDINRHLVYAETRQQRKDKKTWQQEWRRHEPSSSVMGPYGSKNDLAPSDIKTPRFDYDE